LIKYEKYVKKPPAYTGGSPEGTISAGDQTIRPVCANCTTVLKTPFLNVQV
jgi:hypothetical protein